VTVHTQLNELVVRVLGTEFVDLVLDLVFGLELVSEVNHEVDMVFHRFSLY
jgi:hypothetical protein